MITAKRLFSTLLPVCAVCNWRVERLTRLNPVDTTSMQFEVECHGEIERTTISLREMSAPGFRLEAGMAFEKADVVTSANTPFRTE